MPTFVRRPDPPPSDDEHDAEAPRAGAKLTQEEIRALLAVDGATRPSPWKRTAKRGVILVPVGLVSTFFEVAFGDYAWIAIALLVVGALTWAARPLYAGRDDGWT